MPLLDAWTLRKPHNMRSWGTSYHCSKRLKPCVGFKKEKWKCESWYIYIYKLKNKKEKKHRYAYHIENNLKWGRILWRKYPHKWYLHWKIQLAISYRVHEAANWKALQLDCEMSHSQAHQALMDLYRKGLYFEVSNQEGQYFESRISLLLVHTISENRVEIEVFMVI